MHNNNELFNDQPLPDDMLDKLGEAEIADKWPRHVVHWISMSVEKLIAAGMNPEQANSVALTVMRTIAAEDGGLMVYIPKIDKLDIIVRNRAIWKQFSGNNIDELAQQHKLTTVQIYNIIREQRTLHNARVQPDLFPPKQ